MDSIYLFPRHIVVYECNNTTKGSYIHRTEWGKH